MDPGYGWWLTDGDGAAFAERLAGEQRAAQRRTNRVWPRALGTTPCGLTREINRRVAPFGIRYRWRIVDDTDAARTAAALARARGAADRGYPVPMLIGEVVPRHWVVLLRGAGEGLIFYQPSGGRIVAVGADGFGSLGFPHVQAMVLPVRS